MLCRTEYETPIALVDSSSLRFISGTELEAVIADRITTCSLSEESAFYIIKASEKLDTLSDGAQTDAELLITLLFRELIRELLPTAAADVGRFGVSRHISSIETLYQQ